MIKIGRSVYMYDGSPLVRLVEGAGMEPGCTVRITQWLSGRAEIKVIHGKKKIKRVFLNEDGTATIDRDVYSGAKKCPTLKLIKDFGIGEGSVLLTHNDDGTAVIQQ